MTTPKFAAAATQPPCAAAAAEVLARGNAVDAVCAGVLAGAALEPGVLLGPLHVLVTGPGFGVRCIDGRLRQPGVGAPRPRGFLSAKEVPDAARVAAPALPAAIATALSMFGTVTARRASEPALALLAREHPRRALLAALAREGPPALAGDAFADALVEAGGRLAGGLLTRDDLRATRAPALACEVRDRLATAPFAEHVAGDCQVVCAADRHGGLAVACYEVAQEGVSIDALGLVAPPHARPVMRGERRTDPGAPLPCASTVALVDAHGDGRFDVAFGVTGAGARARLDEIAVALVSGSSLEAALREHAPSAGAVQTARAPRAYSFTP
jgi:riboflavin biosynthesis pyrimidine reductase